jgi:hypothetical protein
LGGWALTWAHDNEDNDVTEGHGTRVYTGRRWGRR